MRFVRNLIGLFLLFCGAVALIRCAAIAQAQGTSGAVSVSDLAWSPDGTTIAVAQGPMQCAVEGADYSVHLLDSDTGEVVQRFTLFDCPVNLVTWNPDGRFLAGGREILPATFVWDVTTGTIISASDVLIHDRHFADAWSPDGTRIASTSAFPGINIWNPENGQTSLTIDTEGMQVLSLSWHPDGNRLAAGGTGETTLGVWDADTGDLLFTLNGSSRGIRSVAWSPDGAQLASGGWDNVVRIWDVSARLPVFVLEGHTDIVHDVAWQPGGSALASASSDGTVRVWDTLTGEQINSFTYPGPIYAVTWSPDGRRLAYGGYASTDIPVVEIVSVDAGTSTSTPASTLRDLLSDANCETACFMGIEPGRTTQDELESILNGSNISFRTTELGLTDDYLQYHFDVSNVASVFGNQDFTEALVIVENRNVVWLVSVPLANLSVDSILTSYGAPARIVDSGFYELVYPAEGVAFSVSPDTGVVTFADLATEAGIIREYVDSYPALQPCTEPADICNIATATPAAE